MDDDDAGRLAYEADLLMPPAWDRGNDARDPKPKQRPLMQWHSDSTEPDNRAGTAIWRYVTSAEPGREVVTRVRFESFAAAHEVYKLMLVSWCEGREYGRDELALRIGRELRRDTSRPNVSLSGLQRPALEVKDGEDLARR